MPKVGDRVRLDSRKVGQDPRTGVITSVRGQMISVRWSSGEESSIVPGPGILTVVGRGRVPAKKRATKKAASARKRVVDGFPPQFGRRSPWILISVVGDAGRFTCCCCEHRHAGGAEWRVHANLQSRHYRCDALLLCRPARTTARSARHRRFRWSDAANTAALRMDECSHVLIARFARAERIYWRVSDFQRLVRNGGDFHGRCRGRRSRHCHCFYASDASSLQRTARRNLQRIS